MQVKYIVETKYENGDSFADKLDTIDEVIEILRYMNSDINRDNPPEHKLLVSQLSVYTEEE